MQNPDPDSMTKSNTDPICISIRNPSLIFWSSNLFRMLAWLFEPVLRIQIRLFLSLLDPDPSIIEQKLKKTWFVLFLISLWLFILEKWCKCTFKKKQAEKLWKNVVFLLASWRSMTKTAGSGSIIQRHGSADPYPYQYVTDPQHWLEHINGSAKHKILVRIRDTSPDS